MLSTFDGSIELRAWDRPEVLVVIEKRAPDKQGAAAIEVRAEQDGNRVAVEVTPPRSGRALGLVGPSDRAKLIVSVPFAADVQATSRDGSIDAEGVSGSIEVSSRDGSIRARRLSGDIHARTGDGSIGLDEVNGLIEAATGDGGIRVTGKLTTLQARSGDGSVTIAVSPNSSPNGDWEITTGDGSVSLELPEGFSADIDAKTGDGAIHLDGVTLTDVVGGPRTDALRGRLGSGGRTIRVRTGDGSIVVRRF
jgi:hypothetical protein